MTTPASDDGADPAGRWSALLAVLAERGRLTVAEAVKELGVSEATARRDFNALAREQLVNRVHGGIVAAAVSYGLPARYQPSRLSEAQVAIAAAAAAVVPTGSVVGFNGGTTTAATARALASRHDLSTSTQHPAITVVTNALNIAVDMVLRPYVRTVLLGGVARQRSFELVGPLGSLTLQELWMDVLVLGASGLSADGASCGHEGEAGTNALMTRRADRVVAVVTSDKLGRRAFARICPLGDIGTVVTDSAADSARIDELSAAGIEVVLA